MAAQGNASVYCEDGYAIIVVEAHSAIGESQIFTFDVLNVTTNQGYSWVSTSTMVAQHNFTGLTPYQTYNITITGSEDGTIPVQNPLLEGEFIASCPCDITIDSLTSTPDRNSQSKGSITIAASTNSLGIITYSTGGIDYQSSGLFENLPAGNYMVWAKTSDGCATYDTITVTNLSCDLAITAFSKVDETTLDSNNGTASITATTAAGGLQFKLDTGLWVNGTTGVAYNITNLSPGAHTLYVRDAANCTASQAFTIAEFFLPIPYVFVPDINSLRFIEPVTIDNCSVFETPDNVLFASQNVPGYNNLCYYQKVAKCDVLRIQWQSNYTTNLVEFTNERTGTVYNFTAAVATLPVDYVPPEEYNIIESVLDFTSVPNGYYSVKIKGSDVDLGEYQWLGEPVHLHTDYNTFPLLTYRNFESDFDCEYLTGIIHKIRVPARFYQQTFAKKRTIMNDSLVRPIKLKGSHKRKVKLEIFQIPQYVHEKISKALEHDIVTINGKQYTSEEDYDIKPYSLYFLANAETVLTDFGGYAINSDDAGDIDTPSGGFLEANNGGLLKL